MFTGLEKGLSDFFTKSDVKAYKEFTGENLHGNMYELQLAYLFDEEKIDRIYKALGKNGKSPTKGVTFEFHIDIGKRGETKALITKWWAW